jgi:preprotein translocase subunit SecG
MHLSTLFLILNILTCLALIGVVLLQRSEGGALGGGSPTGLISTRGVGDLLTRTTWTLAAMFAAFSLGMTISGDLERNAKGNIDRLKGQTAKPQAPATAPALPPISPTGQAQPPVQTLPAPGAAAGTNLALPPLAPAKK